MSLTIKKQLVSTTQASKVTSGKGNTRKKVVIHETDNRNKGANAQAHANLQSNGNSRSASWHYQVDEIQAIQSFEHDYKCWAAGTTKGNSEGIQVEICVNVDGSYLKAVQNAAQLVAKILVDEKLTINDVVQHNYYSGKNCPSIMRSNTTQIPWHSFIQMVKSHMPSDKPSTTSTTTVEDKSLNSRAQLLIKKAVASGTFTSEHKDVATYTQAELYKYVVILAERLIK